MRPGIHPVFTVAKVICACGNTFETRSTLEVIKLELCSACHPFFTGQQRLIDTAGRVERFKTRFKKTEGRMVVRKAAKNIVRKALPDNRHGRRKVLTTAPTKEDKSKKEKKAPAKKA